MVLISISKLLLLILRPSNLPEDASNQGPSQGRPALPGRNTNSSTSPSRLGQLPLLLSPHRPGSQQSGKQRQLRSPLAGESNEDRENGTSWGGTPLPSSAPPAPCTAQGAPPIHNPLLPSGLHLWCSERLHLSQSNTCLHSSEEHCNCSGM